MRVLTTILFLLFLTGCATMPKNQLGKSYMKSTETFTLSGNYVIREKVMINKETTKIPLQSIKVTPKSSSGKSSSDLRVAPVVPTQTLPLAKDYQF